MSKETAILKQGAKSAESVSKMPLRVRRFIADVAIKCLENNISFSLINRKVINLPVGRCNGYFREEGAKPELVVAVKNEPAVWLGVLAHESCHLDQFLAQSKIWREAGEHIEHVDNWVINPRSRKGGIYSFRKNVELELDCEKRTCRKIVQYNLPVPLTEYIQRANAYLFSYTIARVHRKWLPCRGKNKDFYKSMPKHFLPLDAYVDEDHPLLRLYQTR